VTLHGVPCVPRFDEFALGPERLRAYLDYFEASMRELDAERSEPIILSLEACWQVQA
jgi:hypothetical protein